MKTYRVLLSCMVLTLMMPAFADDTDGQHQGQGKRDGNSKQQTTATVATTSTNGMVRTPNSFMGFKHLPLSAQTKIIQSNAQSNVQPRPQPQIQNSPVGRRAINVVSTQQVQGENTQFDSRNRRDGNGQEQNRRNYSNNYYANNYDFNNNRNRTVSDGIGSDGYIRTSDPNLTSRGYVRANNTNLSSDGYIRTEQNRSINYGNSRGRYIHDQDNQGWRGQDRVFTQYRMPYRQGYSDRYRVHYMRGWPSNYGWRSHGWTVNYREADPYWFAIITSIALAQAWSDVEVAQAINDENLRQQLIYDEDIRQQMIASGYPADQIYYSDDGYGDQYGYPPSGYDNPHSLSRTYPPAYYPPVVSNNPNSPLYNGEPLASGEKIANRNANQNVLFFCNAGNKQQALEALTAIQFPDMSIWKNIETYNKCRAWAISP
ncbi:MAG: hypothetical protein NVS3B3_13620 [Aquirhabdus sp.]